MNDVCYVFTHYTFEKEHLSNSMYKSFLPKLPKYILVIIVHIIYTLPRIHQFLHLIYYFALVFPVNYFIIMLINLDECHTNI